MKAVSQAEFVKTVLDASAAVPQGLQNPSAETAGKRFDVYRNNVAVSLSDALETAFPVVRKLVGDSFFRAMAGVFLRQHPPTSPLMMFYGEAMPGFLNGFAPCQSLPYLPDIARLELGLRYAYHAADIRPVDAQALGELSPESLMQTRLRFAPAVQLVVSEFPIHAIYRANTVDSAPKPMMRPETVLITRPGFDPDLHLIDRSAVACVQALTDGRPLGQAMTVAGDMFDLGSLLGLLLGQGAVTEIY